MSTRGLGVGLLGLGALGLLPLLDLLPFLLRHLVSFAHPA